MENAEIVTVDLADITQFSPINGFYSLGFLSAKRPDIHWIDFSPKELSTSVNHVNDKETCARLDAEIETQLKKNKIVCLLVWDEDLLPPPFENFEIVCNRYKDERFYLITQLTSKQQKIYTYQGNIQCKILEIPWWWLNDCVQYYQAISMLGIRAAPDSDLQFLCMINRPQRHKTNLIENLYQKGLHPCGKLTVSSPEVYPKFLEGTLETNSRPYIIRSSMGYNPTAACSKLGSLLISNNVENFLYIESAYDMPLIINAETTTGIFQPSEKSLWPALLGRMYLIYGQPWSMSFIQRFHDIDQNLYCDLSFDSVEGDWSETSDLNRLDMMLDTNKYLITHAREIYNDLRDKFQSARWTLGNNILRFCLAQLDRII